MVFGAQEEYGEFRKDRTEEEEKKIIDIKMPKETGRTRMLEMQFREVLGRSLEDEMEENSGEV